jgi:hypothetical protein
VVGWLIGFASNESSCKIEEDFEILNEIEEERQKTAIRALFVSTMQKSVC